MKRALIVFMLSLSVLLGVSANPGFPESNKGVLR